MITQTETVTGRARYSGSTREDRLRAFKRLIAHPHLVAASQAVNEAIREPGGALLIFVCGPTGVGKTTLKNHGLQLDEERAPMLSLLVRLPLHGSFSWGEFLQSGLALLEQPSTDHVGTFCVDNSEEHVYSAGPNESWLVGRSLKGRVDRNLRLSLETALKQRRPAAVIIDDAQYLGRVSRNRQVRDQIDCLKSMAETTETAHVLIGSYELLNLYDACAQSTARSRFVHFPRYGITDEELSQFRGVLSAFQCLLPFDEETDLLLKHWEFCYERSLGCVGILHTLLARAVHVALWAGEKTLCRARLEHCALSESEGSVLMREIHEVERHLAYRPAPAELRQLLGLAPHTMFSSEAPATKRRATSRRKALGPKRAWSNR